MQNLDSNAQKEMEIKALMAAAIQNGDTEGFYNSQIELGRQIEQRVLEQAKMAQSEDLADSQIMIKRGLNPLTADEKKYYNEVITAGGFAGVEKLMPPTVFERVFEDLKQNHPLLDAIEFKNTTGVTEYVSRKEDASAAWWGKLTEPIKKQIEATFEKVKTEMYKLSAFVPVAKAMLELGPQWIDKFVRELLFESLSIALEESIIKGTGKDQPIGMMKNLDGAVTAGVYPDKTAIALADFKPKTLGEKIMAPLTNNGKRTVNQVLMIVNPIDYWSKIFSATTVLSASGTYVYGILPIPGTIVQSVAVPQGKMIAGCAKNYFLGVGSERKIVADDSYKFLEDERTYLAKMYATGKPMDNTSFNVYDISTMAVEIPVL
ncbi:MAG: phage major capsid protein [Oscillospiraceae bacterium]